MRRLGRPRIRRWASDRLVRRALGHGPANHGWAAVAQLHDRGSPATLARLRRLLRSPNAHHRALALDIAAQLRRGFPDAIDEPAQPYALEETRAMLAAGLADANAGVVRSALLGLGHRPWPAALPAMLAHAEHPDARVRFALVVALGGQPGPAIDAALVRLAADRDDAVRDWATFSLGTLSEADDAAVRERLWTNAHDPNRDVRGEAVVGLARRSDARVVELLRTRLLEDDCRVYELEAVEEMPRPELLEPLERLRASVAHRRDLDPYWRRHLEDALDACATMADAAA